MSFRVIDPGFTMHHGDGLYSWHSLEGEMATKKQDRAAVRDAAKKVAKKSAKKSLPQRRSTAVQRKAAKTRKAAVIPPAGAAPAVITGKPTLELP